MLLLLNLWVLYHGKPRDKLLAQDASHFQANRTARSTINLIFHYLTLLLTEKSMLIRSFGRSLCGCLLSDGLILTRYQMAKRL